MHVCREALFGAELVEAGVRVEKFIARENIRRFLAQLENCTDPQQQKTLERLLDAEYERLGDARASSPHPSTNHRPALPTKRGRAGQIALRDPGETNGS